MSASNPFAPRKYGELQKITDRVYLFRNITNSSFVVGDKCVAVVDTQVNGPTAEFLLAALRSVTAKPIGHVVNTHYHWDHTNGNRLFKDQGALVSSSALTKEFMQTRHRRQKEFLSGRGFMLSEDPLLPEQTFGKEHSIDLGGVHLDLFFAGKAESDDATAVFVREENVVMAGDTIMTGSFPIFGQPVWDEGLQGDGQWEAAIENIMKRNPAFVLPGHGPLAKKEDIDLLLRIQKFFTEEVSCLVQKGTDLNGVLKDLEPRLPSWMTAMPVVWGTPRYAILRVYRGLTKKDGESEPGWQKFKPAALPRAQEAILKKALEKKEALKDFVRAAEEATEGGDAGLRLGILNAATKAFPENADAWSAYGDALIEVSRDEASVLEKGDFFQTARICWNHALEIDPAHAGALLGTGRYLAMMAYRGGEDPGEGMAYLKRVMLSEAPASLKGEAEFYYGMGYRRLLDEKNARTHFQNALKLHPFFMPAHLALGA